MRLSDAPEVRLAVAVGLTPAISWSAKILHAFLRVWADSEGLTDLRQEDMAERLHTTPRAVCTMIHQLEDCHLIDVERRRGKPNVYRLLDIPDDLPMMGSRFERGGKLTN